ncbi:hypothetical protein BDD12DRAFT_808889 [Trichophaea hybrida]|nr:hypothetical protein BDD12DRAFT_808889 [Trichophaea hybrida]
MLIPHGFGVFRWPQGDYGIGVLNDNISCGTSRSAFFFFFITGPLNIFSSALVYAANYVRHEVHQQSRWKRFSKPLRMLLMLLVIPAHLLYNSLIFQSISAYDAYQVLVSDSFLLKGQPFNLTTLQIHPRHGEDASIQQYYDEKPAGLYALNDALAQLQNNLASNRSHPGWKNLTFVDCLKRYHSGTFSSFSNVVVVTNWTAPSETKNAAMNLAILAGQAGPKHQSRQTLVSLCPQSFFSEFNLTEPDKWKYVGKKSVGLCDVYVPKKFNVTKNNAFVSYCLSQEEEEKCRLLYSPLVLKMASVCLIFMVACMAVSVIFIICAHLCDIPLIPETSSKALKAFAVIAHIVIALAFIVQLSLMGSTQVSRRGPNIGKGLSRYFYLKTLLTFPVNARKAFLVINIVQLFDTICDAIIIPWGTATWYAIYMWGWHWYLAGMFSMVVKDRYLLTSSVVGGGGRNSTTDIIVPYVDLSSLWFKRFLEYLGQKVGATFQSYKYWNSYVFAFWLIFIIIVTPIIFALPFVGRVLCQIGLFETM